MSFKARSRSVNVSSIASRSSSSEEISESVKVLVLVSCGELGEFEMGTYRCLCSSRPRSLLGRPAWTRRTHPQLRLIQPSFTVYVEM